MKINIHKSIEIEPTIRTELLSSMFEVPASTKLSVSLTGELPDDERMRNYNIGLIVGPSGSGKTLLLNNIFDTPEQLDWNSRSIVDDFSSNESMENISRVCQAVGFNTIPSWLRPYDVLSNGEKFRAEVARRLLGNRNIITIDEFTSVVDRQVAQFACHAIQKYVRSSGKRLVVASCHYDIIPWLQPDWILEPGNPCRFTWRSLRGRPPIAVSIRRVPYEAWHLVKDFHYLSQELNKAARCYGLFIREFHETSSLGTSSGISRHADVWNWDDESKLRLRDNNESQGRLASFCGVLHRPHPRVSDISGFTRMVTLPDFQGLGLAMVLANTIGSAYKALGRRLHSYPNHPSWIRSYQRNRDWLQVKASGEFSPKRGATSTVGGFGGRRCAVFFYVGETMNKEEAEKLIYAGTSEENS